MSEENNKHFFYTSEALLCIASLEGKIDQVNFAWESILGYAPEELKEQSFFDLVHPEEQDLVQDQIEYLSTGGHTKVFTARMRHRGGTYRNILWHATASTEDYSFYASGIDFGNLPLVAKPTEGTEQTRQREEKFEQKLDEKLRYTIEHLPVMVDALDSNGRIILWNRECERVTGFTAEEMINNPDSLSLIYPDPEYRTKLYKAVQRVVSEEPDYRAGEWEVSCKDGSYRNIVWTVNGKLKIPGFAVWGVGVDITERHNALASLEEKQRHLEASEANLRFTIEHLPIMVDAFDADGNILLWNRECERVTGYAAKDMLNNPAALELIYPDPDYRAKMLKAIRRVIDEDPGFSYGEWMINCKSGERKSIAWAVNSKLKIPGYPVWSVGEDVTRRKEALRSLKSNEYRFRTLVENMPIMLKAYDESGKLVMWNRQCEKVTGYTAAEMVGNPDALSILYPKLDNRLHRNVYYEQEALTSWDTEITCKDGTAKTIAWTDKSRRLPLSGWARWLVGEDVTNAKKSREEVDKTNQLLRNALDSLSIGVCATDAQEKIIYANQALCDLTGYSVQELLQNRFAKLPAKEGSSFIYRHYFSFFNGAHEDTYAQDIPIRQASGKLLEIHLGTRRVMDEEQESKAAYVLWTFTPKV